MFSLVCYWGGLREWYPHRRRFLAGSLVDKVSDMSDERRHESQDLTDYDTLDNYDTLDGPLGDDPLDRGVVPPERWSGDIRRGSESDEESLDEQLAEEEPDPVLSSNEYWSGDSDDEDAGDEDVDGLLLDDGPDPRAGRLIAPDGGHYPHRQKELLAHDVGPDGGGATAEEAAVHVVDDLDTE
jgi:hypothetical protein